MPELFDHNGRLVEERLPEHTLPRDPLADPSVARSRERFRVLNEDRHALRLSGLDLQERAQQLRRDLADLDREIGKQQKSRPDTGRGRQQVERILLRLRRDHDRVRTELEHVTADAARVGGEATGLGQLVERCKHFLLDELGVSERDIPDTPVGRRPHEVTTVVARI